MQMTTVPLINLRTSLTSFARRDERLLKMSVMLAEQTGKPEDYVIALLESDVPMTFGVHLLLPRSLRSSPSLPCAYLQ
tara:strand:+ start:295 stop:528 length:234 start_codon:yes stop_codon:yes gene_type:complete